MEPWAAERGFEVAARAGDRPYFPRCPALFVRERVPGYAEQIYLWAENATRSNPTKTLEVMPVVAVRDVAVEDAIDAYFARDTPGYLEGKGGWVPLEHTVRRTLKELLPNARQRRIVHPEDAGHLGDRIGRELDASGLPWLEATCSHASVLATLESDAMPTINNVHRQLLTAHVLGRLDEQHEKVRRIQHRLGPAERSIPFLVEYLRMHPARTS